MVLINSCMIKMVGLGLKIPASLKTVLFNAFELGQNVKIKRTTVEIESICSLCCQNLSDDSPPKNGVDDVFSDTKQFLFLTL